jgi:hypothetical protein
VHKKAIEHRDKMAPVPSLHRATFAAICAALFILRENDLCNNRSCGADKSNWSGVADIVNAGLDILKLTPQMCYARTKKNGTAISDNDAIRGVLFALLSFNQTMPAVGHTVVCDNQRFSLPSELAPAAVALLHSLTVVNYKLNSKGGGFKLNGRFDEARLLALVQSAIASQTSVLPMLPSVRTIYTILFLHGPICHRGVFVGIAIMIKQRILI